MQAVTTDLLGQLQLDSQHVAVIYQEFIVLPDGLQCHCDHVRIAVHKDLLSHRSHRSSVFNLKDLRFQ